MGREVRRVPANWEHPRNGNGRHIALLGGDWSVEARQWLEGCVAWENGSHEDLKCDPNRKKEYPYWWLWAGSPPTPKEYMPEWPAEQRTHYQMYETCSEGTPISPVMATPEELAHWLADNNASSFGPMTATYEQWLSLIVGCGSTFSAAYSSATGLISGVAAVAERKL